MVGLSFQPGPTRRLSFIRTQAGQSLTSSCSGLAPPASPRVPLLNPGLLPFRHADLSRVTVEEAN
eukprot:2168186-Rhodomonas_salina.3